MVKPEVYAENGYMVFPNSSILNLYIEELKGYDKRGDHSNLNVKGFISLEDNNKTLLKSTNGSTENEKENDGDDEIVHDPFLVKLLNSEREIQVGEFYYRITNLGMFRCLPEKRSYIDSLITKNEFDWLNISQIEVDSFIEIADGIELFLPENLFYRNTNAHESSFNEFIKSANIQFANMNQCNESSKTWAGELFAGVLGYSVNCENNFSSDRRVKTVFWAQNWFFYSSVGIKTKMQKRSLGIWWAENAQQLELGWEKIEYKVNLNINSDYYNLAISFDVLNTNFAGLKWKNIINDIVNDFKFSTGRFPTGYDLHKELCNRQFKEWTIRTIKSYNNQYADLIWYTTKAKQGDIINKLKGQTVKIGLEQLYSYLNQNFSNNDPTNVINDFNRVPLN